MAGLEPDKARIISGGKKVAVERHHNPPEVSSRDETDALTPPPPTTVGRLVKMAEKNNWIAEVTYARGETAPTRAGGAYLHSYAVRLSRGAQRAVALWEATVFSPSGMRASGKVWRLIPSGGIANAANGPGLRWSATRIVQCTYTCGASGRRSVGLTVLSDAELKAYLAERDPREGVTPEEMGRAAEALSALAG